MIRSLSISLFCLISFVFVHAEKPHTVNLASDKGWHELGDWKLAGDVVGSPSEKKWKKVTPGKKILFNGQSGKSINLVSKHEHGDVELDVEFMIPKGSNSGLYLMKRYEVQILDSYGKPDSELSYGDCGGIYERWDDSQPEKSKKGYEGTAPSTNASAAPGAWQKFRIQFRAPRFDENGVKVENARFIRVVHNGVIIHEDVEVTGPTRGAHGLEEVDCGPLMIQGDHGPVAIRKLLVRKATFD